jgi:tetratricopeptide (TPR) repeat protein
MNDLRTKAGLAPVEISAVLQSTAKKRATESALKGIASSDNNRLPAFIAEGAFARFALSHEVSAPSFGQAAQILITDTLSKSKILHPSVTHVGIGVDSEKGIVYLVIDLAKLAPTLDSKNTRNIIQEKLDEKRIKNSVELLVDNENLNAVATKAAAQYMNTEESSDKILAEAQSQMKSETFAFGRMTVSFQVVSDLNQMVIPERAADPALAFVGIGTAQGVRKEHEAGAIAVVLIFAEPQTAHDASKNLSDLPPPKAQLRSKTSSDKPIPDQAWTATLTGNHRKAAKLFEKAYQQTKKPMWMYEAARAHARNEDNASALKDMRVYVQLSQGEEKNKSMEMVSKLEKGESIFTSSKAEQMSAEAKRFFVMGQILFDQKQWDGAIDAFQQAYKYSETPEIVYNIGLAHYRAGRIGEALAFFGEYQRLSPGAKDMNQAKQFFDIGVELYKDGRFDAASGQFAMAYSFAPFPELVFNLGLCYKAMGDTNKAIRFFREYLENDLVPDDRTTVQKLIRELSSGRKP